MALKKAEQALQRIAAKEGMSVEEVRREIEAAIAKAQMNPDPHIQAFWKTVPHQGEFPTPEEIIAYIADMLYSGGLKS